MKIRWSGSDLQNFLHHSAVKITISGAWGEDPKRYESESQACNSKRSIMSKTSDRYVKVVAWSEENQCCADTWLDR